MELESTPGVEAGGRWAASPPPRMKQLEIHSLVTKTPRIVGQLRKEAGPCTDHIFLTPEVR